MDSHKRGWKDYVRAGRLLALLFVRLLGLVFGATQFLSQNLVASLQLNHFLTSCLRCCRSARTLHEKSQVPSIKNNLW